MENKEIKKPIPTELDDNILDNISGGCIPCNPEFILEDLEESDEKDTDSGVFDTVLP